MTIGKLNIKVIVQRLQSSVIDEYGSPLITVDDTWNKWAAIEYKRGGHSVAQSTDQWDYDYKITMRFEKSRPTKDNDKIIYNGMLLQINSIQVIEESFKKFEVLKCSNTNVN
jgi:SPP1 family predicted phage head-tail adaptor